MQQDDNDVIRLDDVVHALVKNWLLICITTAIGLGLGIVLSVVSYMRGEMSKEYIVTSSIAVVSRTTTGNYSSDHTYPNSTDYQLSEDMVDAVIYVLKSDKAIRAAIQELDLVGISETDIYNNLVLTQYNETQIIEMSLYWRSAEEGVQILNAINDVAYDVLLETLQVGNVSVINSPSARYRIGGSVNASIWLYMTLIGLALGIGISLLKSMLMPTVIKPQDIEDTLGLEVLGEIPENTAYFRQRHSLLVEDDDPATFDVRESFISAAHILHNRLGPGEHHCLYITSAQQDEGKTNVVANLAVQLSDLEHKVLLVDLDTRNPTLGSLFLNKVDYAHTLNALYRGDSSAEEAITNLTGYLDLLPSILESREIPLGDALLRLIKDLSQNYDYVLMDAAPVGQVAETLSLNRIADTALFVIRFDYSNVSTIRSSLSRLKKSGIKPLGCIVNRIKPLGSAAKPGDSDHGSARRDRPREEAGADAGQESGQPT